MRIVISFFLALFLYSAILFFFVYFLFSKNEVKKPKVVYVHQVISIKKTDKKVKTISKPKTKQKIKPQQKKAEIKTKDKFSKGGEDIKFDDIFSNVEENIPT